MDLRSSYLKTKTLIAIYNYRLTEKIGEKLVVYVLHIALLRPCGAYSKKQFEDECWDPRRGRRSLYPFCPLRPVRCISWR